MLGGLLELLRVCAWFCCVVSSGCCCLCCLLFVTWFTLVGYSVIDWFELLGLIWLSDVVF